ncbi:FAD dependent oxidoreductase [Zopfia rhizophila CBS 207.26]|uniref:FAD dependent oxidoreductase n=1 Tax=Zopfia rhizophila CBS 207.26 TaxID=1314779 RepID=A0A6A6D5C5_9PEZI|nr:FAD dependent oxidoreductase [Zopfia rhizophila CBS 207.26]
METKSQNEQRLHYAVVGGGIFGASTALALKREFPDARISLFKGTHASTASRDINKVIRMAYPDEDYVKFAGQAMKRWETESPYCEFYYRTSWVQVRGEDGNENIYTGPKDKKISTDELLRITGSREEPILGAGEELWLNEDIGYVDSDLALEAVIGEASRLGVTLEEKSVTRLVVDERGTCQGVEVGGHAVTAEETIVAAGAWTPGLLKKSNIRLFEDENKERNFFNVTAVGVATLALGDEEFEQLKSMPILVTNTGEVMPSKKHRVLKMTTPHTFSIDHPDKLGERDIDVGPNRDVLEKMLPQFAGRELQACVCPDLLTPLQHPVVDRAPYNQGLHLAVGGSYHSYKFLPIIGGMVVRHIRGEEDQLLNRWRLERSSKGVAVHPSVVPKTR